MINPKEVDPAIRDMVIATMNNQREGLFTTVSAEGRPHATWMGTICAPDFQHLITLTGTHTDKVANIRSNPHVEWMFTSPDRQIVIYLEGHAETIVDTVMQQRYLQMVPTESRGFFMKYYRAGGDWCVIKTHIESAIYCMPGAYTKVRLTGHQIRDQSAALA